MLKYTFLFLIFLGLSLENMRVEMLFLEKDQFDIFEDINSDESEENDWLEVPHSKEHESPLINISNQKHFGSSNLNFTENQRFHFSYDLLNLISVVNFLPQKLEIRQPYGRFDEWKNSENKSVFDKNPSLVDSWKKVDDLGDDAFDQLRKDPDFLKHVDDVTKNDRLDTHTFKGEVTSTVGADGVTRHKISGIHSSKAFEDGTARIKPGTDIEDLGDGFYKAKVEKQIDGFVNDQGTNWKVKTDKSTFFPDNWSTEKIQAEIAHAFQNKTLQAGTKYQGLTTTGHRITMFLDDAGNIKTAFPEL